MLEAMAAGDAVVATRAGAAEMVISDGDDGVLAPVDDADALIAALEPLMRDPERIEAMGRRAREKVVRSSAATGRPTRSARCTGRSGRRALLRIEVLSARKRRAYRRLSTAPQRLSHSG